MPASLPGPSHYVWKFKGLRVECVELENGAAQLLRPRGIEYAAANDLFSEAVQSESGVERVACVSRRRGPGKHEGRRIRNDLHSAAHRAGSRLSVADGK